MLFRKSSVTCNLVCILGLFLLLVSCEKEKKDEPVVRNYPKTYAEALDSMQIRYEKKYLYKGGVANKDTIIFHADGTITEINPTPPAESLTFRPQNSGDYCFVFQSYPIKDIAVRFYPINDTLTKKFVLHDYLVYDTVVMKPSAYSPVMKVWNFYMRSGNGYFSIPFYANYEQKVNDQVQ